jgi:hypothetical protein
MEIVECIVKNKMLVHADDSGGFNPEFEIAIIKSKSTSTPKFKVACNTIYDNIQPWRALLQQKDSAQLIAYIKYVGGKLTGTDPEFDKVMKEENLTEIMGNVRLIRINYEIKTVTNGNYCEPCDC